MYYFILYFFLVQINAVVVVVVVVVTIKRLKLKFERKSFSRIGVKLSIFLSGRRKKVKTHSICL